LRAFGLKCLRDVNERAHQDGRDQDGFLKSQFFGHVTYLSPNPFDTGKVAGV
jgi:hypothetical protein